MRSRSRRLLWLAAQVVLTAGLFLAEGSPNNPTGYGDDELGELLRGAQTITDEDGMAAAIAAVQQRVADTVLLVTWGPAGVLTVWSSQVHSVHRSTVGILLLDRAWRSDQ